MAPTVGTGEGYDLALGELWPGLARTLTRLDALVGDPDDVGDRLTSSLRRLQYGLHVAAEHAHGLEPPPAAVTAHAELLDALICARDLTSEVAAATEELGAEGVRELGPQWRNALFRVRLARLRLASPPTIAAPPPQPENAGFAAALAALCLALGGALAFAGGATIGSWPLWSAGGLAVLAGVFAYRP